MSYYWGPISGEGRPWPRVRCCSRGAAPPSYGLYDRMKGYMLNIQALQLCINSFHYATKYCSSILLRLMHMNEFIILKPFQCIIYFCVSHFCSLLPFDTSPLSGTDSSHPPPFAYKLKIGPNNHNCFSRVSDCRGRRHVN